DGIRGFHVTGVQTCALPIFGPVALVLVRPQAVVAERAPATPGGVLARAGQLERRVGYGPLEQVQRLLLRVGGRQVGGAGRVRGRSEARRRRRAGPGRERRQE